MVIPRPGTVTDLRATFEARKNANLPPQHPSRADSFTDMQSSKRPSSAQRAAQPSIDAVLETPGHKTSPAAPRPGSSKRPSWIGPIRAERVFSANVAAMKHPVTIEYAGPEAQPPVYIATNLSQPQWQPLEMEAVKDDQGAYKFRMTFEADQGEYQYKIRLGTGDWWVTDDDQPTVDDGDGNKNNVVTVPARYATYSSPHSTPQMRAPTPDTLDKVDSVQQLPLMEHEKCANGSGQSLEESGVPESGLGLDLPSAPLFRHESIAPRPAIAEKGDEEDDEIEGPPLLRHESVAPSSAEQVHSPLFRHESIAIDDKRHEDLPEHLSPILRGPQSRASSIPEEADENDPSLELFPTDHAGIIEHIERTRRSMQEDETSDRPDSPSRSSSSRPSPSGSAIGSRASPSLPCLPEDEEEDLAEMQCEAAAAEKMEAANTYHSHAHEQILEATDRPTEPITPPMTPPEHESDKELADTPNAFTQRAKKEQAKHKLKEVISRDGALGALSVSLVQRVE